VKNVLEKGLDKGICLNVNIPSNANGEIKGIKICKQADGVWDEEFDERIDPHGKRYYWMHGLYRCVDNSEDTDNWALENNYISVVPVKTDFTSYETIQKIKDWEI
jgi:5'-nucleotidase